METLIQERNIWLTYFTDKTTDKIASYHQKIYPLLDLLDCKNYSATVEHFIVILVAFSPQTFPEKDKLFFRRSKNEIEIRINVDYEKLLVSTETETLQLIAQTYLLAIERFLMKRKDFNAKKFYTDVENLFRENGVL